MLTIHTLVLCEVIALTAAAASSTSRAQSGAPPASASATQPAAPPASQPAPQTASERMKSEAQALRPSMHTDLGRAFLDSTANLPSVAPRTIYREKTSRQWVTEMEFARAKAGLVFEAMPINEDRYYDTKYGTPIAYARLFDLLGQNQAAADFTGLKILDFGYGTIGHLRMLASRGADVTGLDVDSFLTALYSQPADTGTIDNPAQNGPDGSITLVNGRFSEDNVKTQVGGGYDLIISKNTLKRGYVQPPKGVTVDKRMLIELGVDNETFLRTLYDALKPGGRLAIYNICPKQNDYLSGREDQPYLPMADGLCPFDRAMFEKVGFRAITLDQDDSTAARAMARLLGWDQGPGAMDVDNGLSAWFTVLQRPAN
jgi:hypothetical protein